MNLLHDQTSTMPLPPVKKIGRLGWDVMQDKSISVMFFMLPYLIRSYTSWSVYVSKYVYLYLLNLIWFYDSLIGRLDINFDISFIAVGLLSSIGLVIFAKFLRSSMSVSELNESSSQIANPSGNLFLFTI